MAFYLILIIGTATTCPSCFRQNNAPKTAISKEIIEPERTVTKLDHTIWSIYQDKKSNHTINIDHKKENGIGFLNEKNQIEFPFFLSMKQDNDGNLWMTTYDNGVWKNDGKQLIHYPIKDGETEVLLFSIYKDNQGVLWLGTFNAGVYKFNGQTFEKFEL
jgi:ligand-binding sensor domain-containing protein